MSVNRGDGAGDGVTRIPRSDNQETPNGYDPHLLGQFRLVIDPLMKSSPYHNHAVTSLSDLTGGVKKASTIVEVTSPSTSTVTQIRKPTVPMSQDSNQFLGDDLPPHFQPMPDMQIEASPAYPQNYPQYPPAQSQPGRNVPQYQPRPQQQLYPQVTGYQPPATSIPRIAARPPAFAVPTPPPKRHKEVVWLVPEFGQMPTNVVDVLTDHVSYMTIVQTTLAPPTPSPTETGYCVVPEFGMVYCVRATNANFRHNEFAYTVFTIEHTNPLDE